MDKLPELLYRYQDKEFEVQQRAKFIYYLCIALIIISITLLISTIYIHINDPEGTGVQIQIVGAELFIFVSFLIGFGLLIKGFFEASSHLLLITALIATWMVLWTDKSANLIVLDSIVYILSIFTIIPIFFREYKRLIIFYITINIFLLVLFIAFNLHLFDYSKSAALDYFIDNAIAMLFIGIVGYNIYTMNLKNLQKIQGESKEKEETRKALDKSERFLKIFVSNVPGVAFYMDKEGIFKLSEGQGLKELGVEPGQLVGSSVYEVYKNFPSILQNINQALAGETHTAEDKVGSLVFETNYKTVFDENNQIVGVLGSSNNISDRKNAERLLIESEEKHRTIINNLNEIIMVVDPEDKVLFVNDRFTTVLGYTKEEIIGEVGYKKLIPPEKQQIIIEANKARQESKSGVYEISFNDRKGKEIDFLVSGAPLRNQTGEIIGSIGALTDITEQKQKQREIFQEREFSETLIDSLPSIFYLFEIGENQLDIRMVRWNKNFYKFLGYDEKELKDKNYFSFFSPEYHDILHYSISQLMINKEFELECKILHTQDYEIDYYFRNKILTQNENDFILGVGVDITKRKQAQKEIEKYQKQLEELVEERTEKLTSTIEELDAANTDLHSQKSELQETLQKLTRMQSQLIEAEKMASLGILSAGIAHEINNPLNFIKGGILAIEDYFEDNLKEHLTEVSPLIDSINTGISRAAEIVSSLNHYSRKDELPKTKCDIHQILDHCLVMLHNRLRNEVRIIKNYNSIKTTLYAREGKIHQALLNIIANADQAIENSGTITLSTTTANDHIRVIIEDNGIGIPEPFIDKIFDPFFTTKGQGEGTGLGLSISYNIIKEHYGIISVESSPGKGTKMIVELPTGEHKNG